MINLSEWGYGTVKSSQSDLDGSDNQLLHAVERCDSSILWCIGCGTCSATCSTGQIHAFNPRKMISAVRMGRLGEVRDQISRCILCGKCQLVCPRNVNTRHIFSQIKRIIGQHEV